MIKKCLVSLLLSVTLSSHLFAEYNFPDFNGAWNGNCINSDSIMDSSSASTLQITQIGSEYAGTIEITIDNKSYTPGESIMTGNSSRDGYSHSIRYTSWDSKNEQLLTSEIITKNNGLLKLSYTIIDGTIKFSNNELHLDTIEDDCINYPRKKCYQTKKNCVYMKT